jgi:hypothetical protein
MWVYYLVGKRTTRMTREQLTKMGYTWDMLVDECNKTGLRLLMLWVGQ